MIFLVIPVILALIALLSIVLFYSIKIVQQYEQGVVLRLGKYQRTLKPGIQFIIPVIESIRLTDMRVKVQEVANQDIITKDSVPVTLNAVVYYQVVDVKKALLDVENYVEATSTVSQTILRKNLGAHTMQEMLTEQQRLDTLLRNELDKATEPWGIKVTGVEIRSMDLPDGLKRAMAKEAESERERKAKVIAAIGEFEAAQKLAEAASVIAKEPSALSLRMLQTMTEIAAEKNSTILFPYEMASLANLFTKKE